MREPDFIKWIYQQGKFDPSIVLVGPGDDCAVLNIAGEKVLITTDQVLDGVHLSLSQHGPFAAGRKAAARGISDIAAMAGVPVAMIATIAAPTGLSQSDAEKIYHGLLSVANQFNCPLIGGDVAAWKQSSGNLAITVSVIGKADGIEPILRSGANLGDAICITGKLGAAWKTNRHIEFTPRVREARILAKEFHITAMIDISDGLAADLNHIVEESSVGAKIFAEDIPIHHDAFQSDNPLKSALYDGEDYELLFTLPAEQAERLIKDQPLTVGVSKIGTIVDRKGIEIIHDGVAEDLPPTGWQHET